MENYPAPGDRFKHYKGGLYEIVSMANHTETDEKMVVYKSLNFGSVFTRPWGEWTKSVDLWFHQHDWTRDRFSKIEE